MLFAVTFTPIRAGNGGGFILGKLKPKTLEIEASDRAEVVKSARSQGSAMGLDLWAITKIEEKQHECT